MKKTGKSAGILIIGNEILSGKTVDSNSPYLCRELRKLGVEVKKISVIPDDLDAIAKEVSLFSQSYDLVFTSGGVGPTHDDVTMEGIARGLGRKVVLHPELEKLVKDFYGTDMNPAKLRMAEVPEGTQLIKDEGLIFPVVTVENIYIFPGIPEILRKKFEAIKKQFLDEPFFMKQVFVSQGEVDIAHHLNRLLEAFPQLLLGSYPELNNAEYKVKLTLESKDKNYLEQAFRQLVTLLPADTIVRVEGFP
jgi:molybdenum cofactor synthesis domain-containing protein